MVFEELTLFEIEIENPQIGPRSTAPGGEEDEVEEEEREGSAQDASSSGGRGRLAVVAVVLALVGVALYRRHAGSSPAEHHREAPEADLASEA